MGVRLIAVGDAGGAKPSNRDPHPAPKTEVHVDIRIDGVEHLSDDARGRINLLLQTETRRIAEIAAVDARDQHVARLEAERLANLPKDRPAVTVAAGTKDPEAVVVTRGTFEVAGRRMAAQKTKGDR